MTTFNLPNKLTIKTMTTFNVPNKLTINTITTFNTPNNNIMTTNNLPDKVGEKHNLGF